MASRDITARPVLPHFECPGIAADSLARIGIDLFDVKGGVQRDAAPVPGV